MILGRHPNLWLGFLTGVWNVIFIAHVFTITPEVFASVNLLFAAFIALLANTASLSIDAGRTALRNESKQGKTTRFT